MNINSKNILVIFSHTKTFATARIALLALLFCLFFINLPLYVAAQSTSWTAPNFIVQPMDPWKSIANANNGVIDPNKTDFKPPSKFITGSTTKSLKASKYLTEAAKIYERVGLLEPTNDPLYADAKARGAFMYKFTGTAGVTGKDDRGIHVDAGCPGYERFKVNWFAVNSTLQGDNLFTTLAHELFHAIQSEYTFQKGKCTHGGWVLEGAADAAAFYLLEPRIAPDFPEGDREFHGLRPYDVPIFGHIAWQEEKVLTRFGFQDNKVDRDAAYDLFSYHTSSFWRFLMDRYPPKISSLGSYEESRLKALEFFMERDRPGSNTASWLNWVAEGIRDGWGPFQFTYSEFLSEFAAWPGKKYPAEDADKWLHDGFGGCNPAEGPVILTSSNTSDTVTLKPINANATTPKFTVNGNKALFPIAGRCLQVTIKGYKNKEVTLKLEAKATSGNPQNQLTVDKQIELADQIVLGFAREEQGKKLADNCYSHARKFPKQKFPCLFYGKVKIVEDRNKKKKGIRTWRFESRKLKDNKVTVTFIFSNVESDPSAKNPSPPRLQIPNLSKRSR